LELGLLGILQSQVFYAAGAGSDQLTIGMNMGILVLEIFYLYSIARKRPVLVLSRFSLIQAD